MHIHIYNIYAYRQYIYIYTLPVYHHDGWILGFQRPDLSEVSDAEALLKTRTRKFGDSNAEGACGLVQNPGGRLR